MTNKQKQCLLCYLGYYTGSIDGIWGTLSKNATKAFQADYGLVGDGIFGSATEKKILAVIASNEAPVKPNETPVTPEPKEVDWDDIEFFTKAEFKCKCGKYCDGYPAEVDMGMVKIADEIRRRIGKPLGVNSGLRCKQHNANVGGASNSNHMRGTACDLGKPSGVTPDEMAAIAEEVMGNTGGIGIYKWGIHVDNRKVKYRWDER